MQVAPDTDFMSTVGRRTCFEVTVNGTLVHSKLATMAFPDYEATAQVVAKVAGGGEVEQVTVHQEGGSWCTIL